MSSTTIHASVQRDAPLEKRQVQIPLGKDRALLETMFSFGPQKTAVGLRLQDVIGHAFNQTLERDGFHGAWAIVWTPEHDVDGGYGVKLTSPRDDLTAYASLIPAFMAAGAKGAAIWKQQKDVPDDIDFLLPFGLAMAKARCVQLLHYPPSSSLQYSDYIYSPTNRRLEGLLLVQGYHGGTTKRTECITDLVPIAADGGSSGAAEVAKYTYTFTPYVHAMLAARLLEPTMPVVAYGTPVKRWLKKTFAIDKIETNELLELPLLGEGKPNVAVLVANHPSEFLFLTDKGDTEFARKILREDLITARWVAHTSLDWSKDKKAVLAAEKAFWSSAEGEAEVRRVLADEDREFGYQHVGSKPAASSGGSGDGPAVDGNPPPRRS